MIRRLLCAVAGAAIVIAASAAAASAHDALTSSNPAAGAQVDVVPAQVQLVFTEPPLGVGTKVQVTGPAGDLVTVGAAHIVDTTVTQPLAADLPAGAYRVRWRVTSSDGHPISGQYTFTATTGPAKATPFPAAATATPTAPLATPAPSPATVAAPDEATTASSDRWGIVAAAIAAAALLAAAVAGITRYRRRQN